MRHVLCVLTCFYVCFAQVADLTTNHDGSELYLDSRLIQPGASTEPHSKILRWTRKTGVQTVVSRTREWTTPWYRNGVLSNYYDVRYPSVSANGLLAFTGYRDCYLCGGILQPDRVGAQVLDSAGALVREIQAGYPDLKPYRTVISPNGLYLVVGTRSYHVPPFAPIVYLPVAPSFASRDSSVGWTIAKRNVIADDGTVVYAGTNFRLASTGRAPEPDFARSTVERVLPASVPVMVPMISGTSKVVVYESLYQQGMPRRFLSLDLATGQERLLFTDAETEDYGPPDFFVNNVLSLSLVPTPEPMFGASIDYSGRYALVLGREAVDKPRQWLYLAPTDLGEGSGEWFAYAEEGYREAVLSGDAMVIFAITNSGRLIRIDRATGAIEDLLPRTPFVEQIVGGYRPGALVRLVGGGFSTVTVLPDSYPATASLGGVEVEFQGQPMIVTRVSPNEIDLQFPWDFQFQRDSLFDDPLTLKVPHDGPLQLPPLKFPISYNAQVLPPGPVREDGAPVTLAHRARSFEVLRMIVSGIPQPPGVTGMPAADRVPVDYACRLNTGLGLPVETLYAGPLPGTIGLSELVVRLPDLKDLPLTFGVWLTLVCDAGAASIVHSIPAEMN